jgi:hypothetical protein
MITPCAIPVGTLLSSFCTNPNCSHAVSVHDQNGYCTVCMANETNPLNVAERNYVAALAGEILNLAQDNGWTAQFRPDGISITEAFGGHIAGQSGMFDKVQTYRYVLTQMWEVINRRQQVRESKGG